MNEFDFNNAIPENFDLIPARTKLKLGMKIKPGGEGPQGALTQSNNSDALYLNCEFIVVSGPYANRRIFKVLVLEGGKTDSNGQSIAANISRTMLRSILESGRNILPTDESEEARAKRFIDGYSDFNGIEFAAEVGIETDKTGAYSDKNKILQIITPDKKDYSRIMAGETIEGPTSQSPSGAPATCASSWPDQQQAPQTPPPNQENGGGNNITPNPDWSK